MISATLLFCIRAMPIISLCLIFFVLFNKCYKTDGKLIAAILHCKIVSCVFLVWADWGSLVYQPSQQIVVARGFTMMSIILILLYAKQQQKQAKYVKKLEAKVEGLNHD